MRCRLFSRPANVRTGAIPHVRFKAHLRPVTMTDAEKKQLC